GELPMELPLDALTNMDTVGMTLAKEEQPMTASLKLCFTDSDSAENVGTMINAAIVFAGLIPYIPEEAREWLGKLDASVSGSCLDISLELTISEVETLMQGLLTRSALLKWGLL
ncbi:MAG: hypothetical protein V3V32_01625, partial [Dehalococcoidia bacterium]